jgi:hypothetical protein
MSSIVLPPKNPAATQPVQFNFLSQLAQGETLSSGVITASLWTGTVDDSANIMSGATTVSNSTILQRNVTAGTAGNIYQLTATATTSAGHTLIMTALLAVTGYPS